MRRLDLDRGCGSANYIQYAEANKLIAPQLGISQREMHCIHGQCNINHEFHVIAEAFLPYTQPKECNTCVGVMSFKLPITCMRVWLTDADQ